MDYRFEYITNLQYKVKSLTHRVKEFETGEKYDSMKTDYKNLLAGKDREIEKLKRDLANANARNVTIRNNWLEIFDDLEKEHAKELQERDRINKALEERALRAERQRDDEKDAHRETKKELCGVKVELEEERGKNSKLVAQLNKDYENSSLPSSAKLNRKKIIVNSREKTDKKPGGQPGHKGHARKVQVPTNVIHIPAPEEYLDNPNYTFTGRLITKQLVNISFSLVVEEYITPEFRHNLTRQTAHADFPEGVVNDVNYGGSVKAFAHLLNSHYNVSIDKVRELMSDLTDGALQISKGMINGLGKEFSEKTQEEQKAATVLLLSSPVVGTDFTSAGLNGKKMQVAVCANNGAVVYSALYHKGHEGVAGTLVNDYLGTLIHDHDITYYSYGRAHQECLAHILRYLKSSMESESHLTWNIQMRKLIQEMIHYRNMQEDDAAPDLEEAERYEARYLEILKTAEDEYCYEPPSDYYKDGYNLYKRMLKYKDSHLLFLRDFRVPCTNNLCERLLRVFKRKLRQVMTFRGFDNISYLCDSLGVIAQLRMQGKNLFKSVSSIYDRPKKAI